MQKPKHYRPFGAIAVSLRRSARTLQALQAGNIDFTVVQKPYEFGYRSVEFLYKAKTEGVDKAKQELKVPPDNIVDTGVEIVTPQNYPDFNRRMQALGIKSS